METTEQEFLVNLGLTEGDCIETIEKQTYSYL